MTFLALIMVLFIWGEHTGVYEHVHDVHYGLLSNYIAELLVYWHDMGELYCGSSLHACNIASKCMCVLLGVRYLSGHFQTALLMWKE